MPWLLVVFGVGLTVGNYVGGKLANRSVDHTLAWVLAGLIIVKVFFAPDGGEPGLTIVSLVLMGAFGFRTVPALQRSAGWPSPWDLASRLRSGRVPGLLGH